MDYLDFYQLEQEPFSNAPISKFYYNSAQHSKAMVRLMYAVDTMKGLALLIGDIGTGKTTLARRMIDDLPEEEYESALLVIIHSGITADWLLRKICLQLGVEDIPNDKLRLLSRLYDRLVELDEIGKKAVVLIDEAQMLKNREIMEEFRGLLNLEIADKKLLTFIFFGLPEIETNLKLDPPLAQRVALKVRLDSFNEESSEAYIKHRFRMAGGGPDIIDPSGISAIHRHSKGIPRMINTICDNTLFEGYLMKEKKISRDIVETVVNDLGLNVIDIKRGKTTTAEIDKQASEFDDDKAAEIPADEQEQSTTADALDELDNLVEEIDQETERPSRRRKDKRKKLRSKGKSEADAEDSVEDSVEESLAGSFADDTADDDEEAETATAADAYADEHEDDEEAGSARRRKSKSSKRGSRRSSRKRREEDSETEEELEAAQEPEEIEEPPVAAAIEEDDEDDEFDDVLDDIDSLANEMEEEDEEEEAEEYEEDEGDEEDEDDDDFGDVLDDIDSLAEEIEEEPEAAKSIDEDEDEDGEEIDDIFSDLVDVEEDTADKKVASDDKNKGKKEQKKDEDLDEIDDLLDSFDVE